MVSFQHVIDVNTLLPRYFSFFSHPRSTEATALLILLTAPTGPSDLVQQPEAMLAVTAAVVTIRYSVA